MARHRVGVAIVLVVAAGLTVTLARADTLSGLKRAEPQPTAEQLAPGLTVEYTYAIMNHVDELKGRKFEPGPPLTHIEWRMGSGTVLTSKSNQGVGASIRGLLLFEKPGTYGFEVTSNDGVRVELGGKVLHEDPGVHPDTTSDRIDVKIDQPGWYPLSIVYFQKRYTATLVLQWVPPGEKKAVAIPARMLARPK